MPSQNLSSEKHLEMSFNAGVTVWTAVCSQQFGRGKSSRGSHSSQRSDHKYNIIPRHWHFVPSSCFMDVTDNISTMNVTVVRTAVKQTWPHAKRATWFLMTPLILVSTQECLDLSLPLKYELIHCIKDFLYAFSGVNVIRYCRDICLGIVQWLTFLQLIFFFLFSVWGGRLPVSKMTVPLYTKAGHGRNVFPRFEWKNLTGLHIVLTFCLAHLGWSGTLAWPYHPASLPHLPNVLVAEWEEIPATRFPNLVGSLTGRVDIIMVKSTV